MATLVVSTQPTAPVFFNLSSPVGQGCPNNAEDVALASFLMSASSGAVQSPAARQVCSAVAVTTSCTPQLIKSIQDLQRALNKTVDGRISVANATGMYQGAPFLIVSFNFLARKAYPNDWPRLDRIPNCPPPVKQLVQRVLIGM